ncbi:MerR family transcriptional regulator [Listeria welshimeri]|uniref:Transcriptional regulator n=1 Tax=Listeria welshimeri TaxID=1643 RepID=A0ABX4IHG8_LISWE|nr:MerR family transcriptional regulator [Listeria welshimeri]MBC1243136.1 MerR family transcriptional regulator [Listeria welshimeri]MBC1409350.1 MerR family transcriptional regulator [Listeria welshimeri]MBC1634794.1 MerR family transcriptional regulator [Listeria welshimeri]MBC1638063.1 MerR family transcriptional regulator [Listeria welshimeri]MBF2573831.1 MerR family transcriptional regulator [Listeria welshimeri]
MRILSTGEIAQLFQISKYKIRHYIDEGILVPKRNPENGYYYFEETDIYRLYQIILFRKIGFSIQEIKESLLGEKVTPMLEQAEQDLQQKIEELVDIQKTIQKIIHSQKEITLNEITFVNKAARYFKKVPAQMLDNNAINYSQAAKHNLPNLEEPFYIFSESDNGVICLKSTKEISDYTFPDGEYACKTFIAENEATIETQIKLFLEELKNPAKSMIVYENIYPSLIFPDAMVYTMEVLL